MLSAQIPVGSWKSHVSYTSVRTIQPVNNQLFILTGQGLFSYTPATGSLETFTSVKGLRTARPTSIGMFGDHLAMGYEDGAIDIFVDDQLEPFLTIQGSSFLSKEIRSIQSFGDQVLITTSFGLVIVDATNRKVIESYWQLGANGETIPALKAVLLDQNLFVITSQGLIRGDFSGNTELLDFSNWYRFPSSSQINHLAIFNNQLFTTEDLLGVLRVSGDDLVPEVSINDTFYSLKSEGGMLYLAGGQGIYEIEQGIFSEVFPGMNTAVTDFTVVDNQFYLGTENNGLTQGSVEDEQFIIPDGPSFPYTGKLEKVNHKIILTERKVVTNMVPNNRPSGVSVYENNGWVGILGSSSFITDPLLNIVDYTEWQDQWFMASWNEGIWVKGSDQEAVLTTDWGGYSLQNVEQLETGLGGLWIYRDEADNELLFTNDLLTFSSFNLPIGAGSVLDMKILGEYIFFLNSFGELIVFDPDSEMFRYIDSSEENGGINDDINSFDMDKDGELWVGTESGIYVILPFRIQDVFQSFRPIFDGFSLLNRVPVLSVKVDAGNRKWVGTDRGVWLFEENGAVQVLQFSEENSPLISNSVDDIEIDEETGEVFLLTRNGLLSYGGDASRPAINFQAAKIYPNPVYPGFSGVVAINGLMNDVEIKIVDIAGNLIWKGESSGGMASWDTTRFNGQQASSGVYFIFSTNEEGTEKFQGKLAIIR